MAVNKACVAAERPMGSDLLATKIGFCKHTSLTTYLWEIEGAIKNKHPDDPYMLHVERRYIAIALRSRAGLSAHNLASRLRALERVGLLPPSQVEGLRVYAKAIDKATARNAAPRQWTTAVDIQLLGGAGGALGMVPHLFLLPPGSGLLPSSWGYGIGGVGVHFPPQSFHLFR